MKSLISTLLITISLSIMPAMPASATTTAPGLTHYMSLSEMGSLYETSALACPRGTFKVRKHTRTKKKVVNSLIAGGVGAAVGGGLGGGRGALLGAGIGAGSYLTYRYVKDRKGRCVRRYL